MKQLLKYIKPYKGSFIASFIFLLLAKAMESVVPLIVGQLTKMVITDHSPHFFYLGAALLFIAFGFLMEGMHTWFKAKGGEKALYDLRQEVFAHIQSLPIKHFDEIPSGLLLTRTIHDVEQVSLLFSDSLIPLIGSFFLFISMIIAVLFVNIKAGIILLILLPFGILLVTYFRRVQMISFRKVRSALSSLNAFIQERLQGVFVIREFGLEKREKTKFERLNRALKEAHLATIRNFAAFIAGIDLMTNFFILISLVLILFSASGITIDPGNVVMILLYGAIIFRPLVDLAERYNVLQSSMAAFERIMTILEKRPENEKKGDSLSSIDSLEFSDVSFAYERGEQVLDRFNLKLEQGEFAAIVGLSGSGKTTILSLILRFYESWSGKILINGRSILDYSRYSLRQSIAPVFQEPVIITGTIKDNITLYSKEEDAVIKQLIENLGLTIWMSRFSKGIHTPLKERGKNISLGEAQIISLLRALYHNTSLILLDEALSSVDPETEKTVETGLINMLKTKMAIVISHRFSIIKRATKIIVMEHGAIKEVGTHQELLQNKGIYEKLTRLQQVGFERYYLQDIPPSGKNFKFWLE